MRDAVKTICTWCGGSGRDGDRLNLYTWKCRLCDGTGIVTTYFDNTGDSPEPDVRGVVRRYYSDDRGMTWKRLDLLGGQKARRV